MTSSLRFLLSECLDYAGLFPPARLSLDKAFCSYLAHRQRPEAWMLGRFVCLAARLAELAPLIDGLPPNVAAVRVSVTGSGGETMEEFLQSLRRQLREVHAFQGGRSGRAVVESFEVRLPAEASARTILERLLDDADAELSAPGLSDLRLFCELPPGDDWRERVAGTAAALQARNVSSGSESLSGKGNRLPEVGRFGLKLRTGGLERAMFPTAAQVACMIVSCRDAQVFWKATAGLHQPLTHFDDSLGVRAFGFVNVLAASVLAAIHSLDETQVRDILEEGRADRFRFGEEGLIWNDLCASPERIGDARCTGMVSFGSCSFDEPAAGLRELGWL